MLSKPNDYKRSHELFAKATELIPGGIYGLQNPMTSKLFPIDSYPFFVEKAKGNHILDVDGNDFIDYRCSQGEISLGYREEKVEEAVRIQMTKCDNVTLASRITVELAEFIVSNIWTAEWVAFSKTPQEALRLAIKGARSYTSKTKTLIFEGYRSITMKDSVVTAKYGDIESVKNACTTYDVASVVFPTLLLTESGLTSPSQDFVTELRKFTKENGIILIFDDILTALRSHLKGGDFLYKTEADLLVVGSSVSNGYSFGAVVGKNSFKTEFAELEYTENFFASSISMAAALATLKTAIGMEFDTYVATLGKTLKQRLKETASKYNKTLTFSGIDSVFSFSLDDENSREKTAQILSFCASHGVLFSSGANFIPASLSDYDIDMTISVFDEALKSLK